MKNKQELFKIAGKTIERVKVIEAHSFLSHTEIVALEFTDGTQIELKVNYHI